MYRVGGDCKAPRNTEGEEASSASKGKPHWLLLEVGGISRGQRPVHTGHRHGTLHEQPSPQQAPVWGMLVAGRTAPTFLGGSGAAESELLWATGRVVLAAAVQGCSLREAQGKALYRKMWLQSMSTDDRWKLSLHHAPHVFKVAS